MAEEPRRGALNNQKTRTGYEDEGDRGRYSLRNQMTALDAMTLVLQGIAGVAGILLLYVALLTYRTEDAKIQSRIEDWWILLNDERLEAETVLAALAYRFSKGARTFIAGVLGKSFWSIATLRAAIVLTIPTMFASVLVIAAFLTISYDFAVFVRVVLVLLFVSLLPLVGAYVLWRRRNHPPWAVIWVPIAMTLLAATVSAIGIVGVRTLRGLPLLDLTLSLGSGAEAVAMLAWIALVQWGFVILIVVPFLWFLRASLAAVASRSTWRVIMGLAGLGIAPAPLVILITIFSSLFVMLYNQYDASLGGLIAGLIGALAVVVTCLPFCTAALVLGLSVLLTYLLLVAALLFGRTFDRALYRIAEGRLASRKPVLFSVGVALLGSTPWFGPLAEELKNWAQLTSLG